MTVLKRWDGCRIWYPNSLINVVPILNITRSENKWEFFKVWVIAARKLSESLFMCWASVQWTLHTGCSSQVSDPEMCHSMKCVSDLRCCIIVSAPAVLFEAWIHAVAFFAVLAEFGHHLVAQSRITVGTPICSSEEALI